MEYVGRGLFAIASALQKGALLDIMAAINTHADAVRDAGSGLSDVASAIETRIATGSIADGLSAVAESIDRTGTREHPVQVHVTTEGP